jgi:hypothetical protein
VNGQGIEATILEGVSPSVIEPLRAILAPYDEPVGVHLLAPTPIYDVDWLAPALVQIDTYWQTAVFDAMLGNIQEGRADEDIQDVLIACLQRARKSGITWFLSDGGEESHPTFRLRAFLEAHRSIRFTVPSDVDDEGLRLAIETLGDAVCYATDVEQELSHDGMAAGVIEVEMVFVAPAGLWMEAHFDDEYWDEDEEDSEISGEI